MRSTLFFNLSLASLKLAVIVIFPCLFFSFDLEIPGQAIDNLYQDTPELPLFLICSCRSCLSYQVLASLPLNVRPLEEFTFPENTFSSDLIKGEDGSGTIWNTYSHEKSMIQGPGGLVWKGMVLEWVSELSSSWKQRAGDRISNVRLATGKQGACSWLRRSGCSWSISAKAHPAVCPSP